MKIFFRLFVVLFLFLFCSKNSTDPQPVDRWPFDPPSTEPLDAFEMNRAIWRGLNMGNTLEAPREGEWGFMIQDEHLKIIADAGFTSVRLPVSWPAHSETAPPFSIDETFFKRVDHVVQEALKNNLTVILNIHHFDQLNDGPETHAGWLKELWVQIADRYKEYPDELYFEILNEPHGDFTALIWNELLAEVIDIIRKNNPTRMIVVGPVSWNSPDQLPTLNLPQDDRGIIVTYHFYSPFQFTHQGASWVGGNADDWLGTKWMGSMSDREAITKVFDKAVAWAREHNRPLYLGEFGAYSTADDNSRYRWTDFVARSAEQRDISWTYWEFGAGFGAYNRDKGEWRDYLLYALMPK